MTRSINAELNSYALVSAQTQSWRGGPGIGTGSPSTSFSTAATFYFSTQPSGATDESVLVTLPVVQARNVLGNDLAIAGITVALSMGSGSTVGGLSGVLNVITNANGASVFTSVTVDSSNSTIGVVLIATPNGGQPAVSSTAFQVNQKYVAPPSGAGIGAGPNIPAGLAQSYWSTYDGLTVPAITPSYTSAGQQAAAGQAISLITVGIASPNTVQSALANTYAPHSDPNWPLWFPDGTGGGAPARWTQSTFSAASSSGVSSGFSEVYIRMQIRYQGLSNLGFATSSTSTVPVIYASGTTNSLTSTNANWVVDQYANMFLRKGAYNILKILSNTTNKLSLSSGFVTTNFAGDQFNIRSWQTISASTGSGFNVGVKCFFMPVSADVWGSGIITAPSGLDIPWSVATQRITGNDGNYSLSANDYIDGIRLVQSGATEQALSFCYKCQQNDWDGNSSSSSGGWVGTWGSANGNFTLGWIPRTSNVGPDHIGYRTVDSNNSIFDVEIYLKMNSASGTSDGIFKLWVDGVSKASTNTACFCPNWGTYRVEAGATDLAVPVRTANPRFRSIFHDPTYGGGLRIPQSLGTEYIYGMYMAGR